MEGWMVLRRCLLKPLPLSCLLHLAGLLLLASWLAHAPAAPEELPAAEVVMELPPEPQPADESQEDLELDKHPAVEEANIAAAVSHSGEESTPSPLLQAMASSLAGAPDDGAAQTTMAPASEAVKEDKEKTDATQRVVPSAEMSAALPVTPLAKTADGIPATASSHIGETSSGGVPSGAAAHGTADAVPGAGGSTDGAGGSDAAGDGASDAGASSGNPASTESAADIAARFAARVEANKEYPYSAVQRQQQGAVTTSVTLSADGSLLSADIVASSGISSLDQSALAAVRASCPFAHGAGHSITIEVTTRFDLQE